MRPVLPPDGAPVEKAEVRLLNELGGAPAVITTLVREDVARHRTQLVLHQRREGREGLAVALAPGLKKAGEVRFRLHSCEVYPTRS